MFHNHRVVALMSSWKEFEQELIQEEDTAAAALVNHCTQILISSPQAVLQLLQILSHQPHLNSLQSLIDDLIFEATALVSWEFRWEGNDLKVDCSKLFVIYEHKLQSVYWGPMKRVGRKRQVLNQFIPPCLMHELKSKIGRRLEYE